MAQIAPFRGICFNLSKVAGLDKVVSPPYDTIHAALQQRLLERSPHNIVRLILGNSLPHNGDGEICYGKAAELFRQWQSEEILLRDDQPAIYLYDQNGQIGAETVSRKGFIALARIEDFSSGMVKPHEQTRFDWCRDRLQLLRHCQANFSPVFSLYSDPCCVIEAMTGTVRKQPPALDVVDDQGIHHQVWRIHDNRLIKTITEVLDGKPLLIADGHHRYETALNYRDEQREQLGEFSGKETFNYISMYFSNMEDPGCQTVARHLLLQEAPETFLQLARSTFQVIQLDEHSWHDQVARLANATALEDLSLLFYADPERRYRLVLNDFEAQSHNVRHLLANAPSTTHGGIVYRAVLDKILKQLPNQDRLENVHYVEQAMEAVDRQSASATVLLPSLSVSTVRDIANSGGKIPENSTCFYPGVLSGLVINPLIPGERISDYL
nr:DUF1015 domain-containing protein [uncultured Desulfuromonas sp.]